jgi:hypothetical protein
MAGTLVKSKEIYEHERYEMTSEEMAGLTPEEKKEFDTLREKTECEKGFDCIHAEIELLCKAKYHTDVDTIECLEGINSGCRFSKPFASTWICTCPMRKFFALNFEEWMDTEQESDLIA